MTTHQHFFYGQILTFNEAKHTYTWAGKRLPSVTTIIARLNKPMLVQWAANMAVDYVREHQKRWPLEEVLSEARYAHARQRDVAGVVGRIVHDYACAQMEGKGRKVELPDSDEVHRACAAFDGWLAEHDVRPTDGGAGVERFVVSKQHLYAGRCDFFGLIDGRPSVLDFKTGKGVYDEAWYQMAGYDEAICEELNQPFSGLDHWLVHLDKNAGECRAYWRMPDRTSAARNAWRALVQLDKAIRAMPPTKEKTA